ncbi:kinetochore protein Nuf2 [Hippocampus zosterae]|uniref:kinetochore protein Nuf2 n=1 Tax=Hippocampus zosterae TaxID=109293 RepID=UPI00223DCB52|nr:kinetochore protein Nuf2 [Hippocampus zosterae]
MAENAVPVHPVDVVVTFYRTEVLTGEEAKHFTKSDLAPSPKPEAVQSLYMRVLHQLFRFRPECHSMVPLVENIQHPECHEGATAILSVYARMRQFLPMCFVYDFSLNDLLAPKKHRTLTILSAIMNFLQFRKQRINVMSAKQVKFRAALDMQQTYAKGTQEAEKKIEILTSIPPEQQAEDAKLEAALSELQANTTSLYKGVNAKNDTIAEWKARIAEKTQKLTQLKMDGSNIKEEITKLKSQIVESPEELQVQMERMRENIKDLKSSIGKTDEDVVQLQNMVQTMNCTDTEIQQMYNLLQDLEISMSDSKQQDEEHKQLISQHEKKQKELKNLCKEEEQLKQVLDMKLDREAKHNVRRQKKKEDKEQHVNTVLGQCNQIHQKRQEKVDKIQEVSQENQQLRVDIQSLTDVCSQETKKAQVMYDTLSTAMDELDQRIETTILNAKEDAIKMLATFQ